MADLRLFSRKFITEFIELYKSFPCLWKVGSPEYLNRAKRELAYSALLTKYREVHQTATRDEVKKKIYGLRSSYRRELTKLKQSIHTGTTLDDVYKPTLWYFYLFDFLSESESLKEPTSTTDEYPDVLNEEEVEYDDEEETTESEENDEQYDDDDDGVNENDPDDVETRNRFITEDDDPFSSDTPTRYTSPVPDQSESLVPSTSSRPRSSPRKKRKLQNSEDRFEPIEQLQSVAPIEPSGAIHNEDQFDVYGKLIAHKLRSFDRLQATFSQRLINEVLYEGEMGFLNRNCKIVDTGSP